MGIFSNPFFSIKGQEERLLNVAQTLEAAVVPQSIQKLLPTALQVGGVQANTSNKVVNKVLETAANHPFATAGVATVVANPANALAAAKEVGSAVVAGGSKFIRSASAAGKEVYGKVSGAATLIGSANKAAAILVPKAQGTVGAPITPIVNTPIVGHTTMNTQPAQIIVDPLAGSGTSDTAAAAQAQASAAQSSIQAIGGVGSATEFLKNTVGGFGTGSPSNNVGGGLGFLTGAAGSSSAVGGIRRVKRHHRKKKPRVSHHKRHKGHKAKRTSHHKARRGIHYTKNGQPYKIMSNGRARFIKKRGHRRR